MIIPWPLKTTFIISSSYGDETFTVVAGKSDTANDIISKDSPLGKSLLLSGASKDGSYETPDKQVIQYKIIRILTPPDNNDSFKSPLDYYLITYRTEPKGIRNNPYMASICLTCGHENIHTLSGYLTCEVCKTSWYVNRCWHCINKRVDSRDPRNHHCHKCNGYKCAECGNCFCDKTFKS